MYDLKSIIQQQQSKRRQKYIYFWGHQPQADGTLGHSCFSQWWQAPFVIDDNVYATAEHYMMAQKALLFNDDAIFAKILAAKHPKQVKALGREVGKFDEVVWQQHRYAIVVAGNLAKFYQHKKLGQYLINTGTRVLVEASPYDKVWGVGLAKDDERIQNPEQWKGLNLLGFALMEVRDSLVNQQYPHKT